MSIVWSVRESSHSKTAVGSIEGYRDREEVNSKVTCKSSMAWLEFKILPDWIVTMEQSMERPG